MATSTVPMAPPTEVSPATGSEHRSGSGDRPPAPAFAPPVDTRPVDRHRLGTPALFLLRLALGVEFLWAFFDKLFGLGYSTPSARAWLEGGSPTQAEAGVEMAASGATARQKAAIGPLNFNIKRSPQGSREERSPRGLVQNGLYSVNHKP